MNGSLILQHAHACYITLASTGNTSQTGFLESPTYVPTHVQLFPHHHYEEEGCLTCGILCLYKNCCTSWTEWTGALSW